MVVLGSMRWLARLLTVPEQGGELIDTSIGIWATTRLRNEIREGFLVLRWA